MVGAGANAIGSIAGAAKNLGSMFGGWGQTGNSQSQGGSVSQGGGHSETVSFAILFDCCFHDSAFRVNCFTCLN